MNAVSTKCFEPVPAATRQAILAESAGIEPRPLWRAQAVALAVKGELDGDFCANSLALEPAGVVPASLCLVRDNEQAMDAFARGASGVLSLRRVAGPHVRVDDLEVALARLARASRNRSRALIVGQLGFGRDPSVPAALAAAFGMASRGGAWTSPGGEGLPAGLARLPAGRSHALFALDDIADPAPLRPHVVAVGRSANREEALRACAAIEPGGAAVLPADHSDLADWRAAAMDAGAQAFCFGRRASADFRLVDCVPGPGGGAILTAEMAGRPMCCMLGSRTADPIAGLAVLGAMRAAGAALGAAALALAGQPGAALAAKDADVAR